MPPDLGSYTTIDNNSIHDQGKVMKRLLPVSEGVDDFLETSNEDLVLLGICIMHGIINDNKIKKSIINYEWKTPIEFIVLMSCQELAFWEYSESHINYKEFPIFAKLMQDVPIWADVKGPKKKSKLVYLGMRIMDKNISQYVYYSRIDSEPERINKINSDSTSRYRDEMLAYIKDFPDLILEEEGAMFEGRRYMYATKFTMCYENLYSKKIHSIRPFGNERDLFSIYFVVSTASVGYNEELAHTHINVQPPEDILNSPVMEKPDHIKSNLKDFNPIPDELTYWLEEDTTNTVAPYRMILNKRRQ